MLGQRGFQWRHLPTRSTGGLHLALFFLPSRAKGRSWALDPGLFQGPRS